MYTTKERAELADICYMTIEKECANPLGDINTALVDACLELADLLLDIKPLSQEELDAAKQKIKAMSVRRRKSVRIRIIAAVAAVLLLLGTTVYAFSDWIVEVFGIETLQTIEPGDKVTVDNNVLDAAETKTEFSTVDELYKFVDDSILLPAETSNVEFIKARYGQYTEYNLLITTWTINGKQIDYTVTTNDKTINIEAFNSQEFDYYSPLNHAYDIIDTGAGCQATTVIGQSQYTVFSFDREILIQFIETLK